MPRAAPTRPPVALVTGASSGIGEALAAGLARRGHDLVLVARRAEPLEALARTLAAAHGVRAWAMPADLAEPGAAAALAARLRRARRRIDWLVNNAGQLAEGPFVEQPHARHRALIALNTLALTELIAEFAPPMLARGAGRVLNVASVAAFQPVPMLATYAATKAYVLSLTESLAEEWRGSGVVCTALCPGITATAMLEGARRDNPALERLPALVVGRADEVAEAGIEAALRGEVVAVPGLVNQAAVAAGRLLPAAWWRRLSGRVARSLR